VFCALGVVTPALAQIELIEIICPFKADAAFHIVGANGEMDGVDSEYAWLAKERPGWGRSTQTTLNDDKGRIYDLLTIIKGSHHQVICFDITDFYGKMD
jgi:hypothetical protein